MKNAELAERTETEALLNDQGLMISPRPTVDREKLEHHLREALNLLHVDLQNENLRDTPRRWAESLVTMTSDSAHRRGVSRRFSFCRSTCRRFKASRKWCSSFSR